ncbi:hypothetical protein [Cryobacterium luteum]|uniref:Polyketide cyclase / dehydrase and lipid transport n=1 Tax=Cryobacterium luteum TaxID=1424661 RepID=A0A1H8I2G5_9MICO|nr:hypothetical protein [Cryobacterium luteum]TFB94253.1 hypothetical protein E3O10_02065 [Cryobacterium luteum]SEN62118.1 hypothetical protein SAMN05216281_110112 [Cryobacterium luteum]
MTAGPQRKNGPGFTVRRALHCRTWASRTILGGSATGFSIGAEGDLVGTGRWSFSQDDPEVEIRYDWRVNLAKRGLRRFVPLLKPLFAANHRWAMRTGEQSLKLELRRSRARTEAERRRIPAPPQPTFRRRRKVAAARRVSDVEF